MAQFIPSKHLRHVDPSHVKCCVEEDACSLQQEMSPGILGREKLVSPQNHN